MSRKVNQIKSVTTSAQNKQYATGFGDNFYYISKILKERTLKNGKVQLYVQWEGWPAEYNSWVYKETLMPVQQLMSTLVNSQQGSNQEKQKQQITSSNLIENNSQKSQINYKSKYKKTKIRKTTQQSMSKNQISLRSLESIQHTKSSLIQNIRETTQIIHQFHQSEHKSNKNSSKKSQKSQHKKIKDKLQYIKKSKNQYQKNTQKKKSKIQINADKNLRKSKQISDQFQTQSQDTNQNRYAIKKPLHKNIQQKSHNISSGINNKQKDKKQPSLLKLKQKISNKSSGGNNQLLINIGQDTSELLDISKISFQSQMSSIMGFSFFKKDNSSGNRDKQANIKMRPRDKFSLEKRFKINANKKLEQNKVNVHGELCSGQQKQRKKMFSKDFQIFNNRTKQIKNLSPSQDANRRSQQQVFNKAKVNISNQQNKNKATINQLGKDKQTQIFIQQQSNLSLKNSITSNQKNKKIKQTTVNKTNLINQIQIADKLLNKKTEIPNSSQINKQKQNISQLNSIKQISLQIQSSSMQKNNKKQQQAQIVLPMQLLLTKNSIKINNKKQQQAEINIPKQSQKQSKICVVNKRNKKQQQQIINDDSECNKLYQGQDQQKIHHQQKTQEQNFNNSRQKLQKKQQQIQQSLILQNQSMQIKNTKQNNIPNRNFSNQNNDISSNQDIPDHNNHSKATYYYKQLQQNSKNIQKAPQVHQNSQHTQNSQGKNNIMQLYYRRMYPQLYQPSQDIKTVKQPKQITKQHKLINQHKVKESYSKFQRINLFKQNQVKIQESSYATAQQDEQQYQKPTQVSNKPKTKNITKRNNKATTKKSRKTNKTTKSNKKQQKQTQYIENDFDQLTNSKLMDQIMLQNENNIIFCTQISSYSDNQAQQQQKSIKNIRNSNSKFNSK